MKKKILFTAYNMGIGGIEKALLSLLKTLDYKKYDVTLILQRKEGVFLSEIPSGVKVVEYKTSNNANVILRKIKNRTKILYWILRNYKKFDFAGCFATSCIPCSILARYSGKKSAIWVHANYKDLYNNDKDKINKFFSDRGISQFDKIIFVSNESRVDFVDQFKELKGKCHTCNNIIDYNSINEMSKEKIDLKHPSNKTVFINVTRLEEDQKRITRLIRASKMLADSHYQFEVWLVGGGPDEEKYKELVKKDKMEGYIKFFGAQKNPYPYYAKADVFILTSRFEGFPVVYIESLIFNLPIITTVYVTDNIIDIKNGYGVVIKDDDKSIYKAMKEFIDKGFKIKHSFDPKLFNKKVLDNLEKIINE
jgi:glycosyltransferase involved in cell wall biosynthesis